jgi:hypothetical protein
MPKIRFSYRSVPWLLLILCVLGFGLLIPTLGLYWDDWPVILMTRLQGARGFWDFYQYDRPISAWTYILTAPILGSRPLGWHIFTLLLRWATVLGMWWAFSNLWPAHKRDVTWMAILFAIAPSFLQQPVAVAFSQHWITYALYFLSIGCMLQAIRSPRWFWPLTLIAWFSCGLHLLTMEYFIGLELLRPVFLWILIGQSEIRPRNRLLHVLKVWAPYLAILILFIIWRVLFLELAGKDPNRPDLIYNLSAQPFAALLGFIQTILQDYLHILAGAWAQTIVPGNIDLTSSFFLFSLAMALLGGALIIFYLLRLQPSETPEENSDYHWIRQAALLGLGAIFLGFLPAWITERQAIEGLYGSRFSLAAMFGMSILLVSILEWFTPRMFPKVLLISVLVGFSILFHIQNTNDYRWSWINQRRFYWQLSWRAPYILPHTAILSDGELFPFVGIYSTTTGLNLLYPQPTDSDSLSYWFYSVGRGLYRQIPQLLAGIKLKPSFRTFRFDGNSANSLVIYYEPAEGRCLWVLDPQDSNLGELPELTLSVLPLSNLSRILPEPPEEGYPPAEVFGDELDHTWCYYFQKADLARQSADWSEITRLGDEASQREYKTDHYREALPFIEAFAKEGNWDEAHRWTMYLNPRGPNKELVCDLWQQLSDTTPAATEKELNLSSVFEHFTCQP